MKISKIISKTLLISQVVLLINPIISIANQNNVDLERYENLVGNQIVVNNNRDVGFKDISIEGNTQINLLDISSLPLKVDIENMQGEQVILDENSNGRGTPKTKGYLKANTDYTAFVELSIDNNLGNLEDAMVYPQMKIWYMDGTIGYQNSEKVFYEGGIYTIKIKLNSSKDIEKVHLNVIGKNLNNLSVYMHKAILLEGDYEEGDFIWMKDVQSVGEKSNNSHNIEIKSENKAFNLLNRNIKFHPNATNISINEGVIEYDATVNYTSITYDSFYFEEGKRYTIAIKGDNSRVLFVNNGRLRSTPITSNDIKYTTFTAKKGDYTHYIENGERGACRVRVENVWIYEGEYDERKHTTDYDYNSINIPLKEPLRGLSNGAKDKIIKKNGDWYVERNLAQITFDGSSDEEWFIAGISKYMQLHIPNAKPDAKAISDRLPYNAIGAYVDYNPIGMYFVGSSYGIRIKPFLKDDMTLEEGVEWLRNNPLTVIYELGTPVYEKIDKSLDLYLYENLSYVSNNSEILATMKLTVDRVVNRVEEAIAIAESNPTIENISRVRMWVNQMPESLLKDTFQEELEMLKNSVDLNFERKSVTVNIDLYIKSENMLLMSLDTNSITFEDFSGIEDMIKENAVNISVNSSLPYQLNAYLPVEIQNSDKSNTMDKSILNIKENSESNYQVFPNAVDKVVLKDNCPAGNDLIHGVDIKLKGGIAHEKDVYKTTIKFEAEQK